MNDLRFMWIMEKEKREMKWWSDLKPCPKCGRGAVKRQYGLTIRGVNKFKIRLKCLNCGFTTKAKRFKFMAKRDWNNGIGYE